MKALIEELPVDGQTTVTALIVDDGRRPDAPVLLFLHGKGEASRHTSQVPLVCVHHSPPFQAILGRLRDVVVVAPQAPHDPDDEWTWAPYAHAMKSFLHTRFAGRRLVATGFSRGGLGVLQLIHEAGDLFARWAIIDPQRAAPREEKALLTLAGRDRCWLRYGNDLRRNTPFTDRLARTLNPADVGYLPTVGHAALAMRGYSGDRLEGREDVYAFLELEYGSA